MAASSSSIDVKVGAADTSEGGMVDLTAYDWPDRGVSPTGTQDPSYQPEEEPTAEFDNDWNFSERVDDRLLNKALGDLESRHDNLEDRVDDVRTDLNGLTDRFNRHNHDDRYYKQYIADDRFVNEEDGYLSVNSGAYLDGGGRIDLRGARTLDVDYDALRNDLAGDIGGDDGYIGPTYLTVNSGGFLDGGGRINLGGSRSLSLDLNALRTNLDDVYVNETGDTVTGALHMKGAIFMESEGTTSRAVHFTDDNIGYQLALESNNEEFWFENNRGGGYTRVFRINGISGTVHADGSIYENGNDRVATRDWVTNNTSSPDLSGYATENWVGNNYVSQSNASLSDNLAMNQNGVANQSWANFHRNSGSPNESLYVDLNGDLIYRRGNGSNLNISDLE